MLQTMKLKCDGTIEQVKPSKKKFTLQELQAAVNGMIEIYNLVSRNAYMVVNEEGKLLGLPVNTRASVLFQESFGLEAGLILGDALITQINEID